MQIGWPLHPIPSPGERQRQRHRSARPHRAAGYQSRCAAGHHAEVHARRKQ